LDKGEEKGEERGFRHKKRPTEVGPIGKGKGLAKEDVKGARD
jgi:hypothetical protein